ncbi:enoyl-CoA hydratase [Mycobacterium marinum]|uniref:enoyl-CoA hydratase/isomerase family protein n=1 Tax=Mycobacterium marinum TaxID=1781 RepID=UPI0021C36AFD|nr:enoyl-CoA hydratase/isomerase family protein [Mycobacterium marinum]GJO36859.1 enoyl-CoA hydratase [Mycobacterium marinum]
MTAADGLDDRVQFEADPGKRIATITLNNPTRRNAYDAAMRDAIAGYLDRVAADDDLTVVILRGTGGVFSAGADMNNAYGWYGEADAPATDRPTQRRPSQRRRLTVDRRSFSFYHNLMGFPKVTVGEIAGHALGGGFEMALMTDISVIARNARIGMPATRFLGPALGSLHMFFHRLGPVLARRLLLTGDIIEAGDVEHLGIFTDTCDPGSVAARARYWAAKAAKMPADGIVIAKEAFRLVEQTQAYAGEEVASYLFHAFGTNLQFAPGEFNFVKTRAEHGTKEAFRLRDEHFHVPEPES